MGEVYPRFADVLEATERFLDENRLSVDKPVAIKYWTLEQVRENWRALNQRVKMIYDERIDWSKHCEALVFDRHEGYNTFKSSFTES